MNEVPPGALISFIQKGLMYLELEANLNNVRPSQRQRFPEPHCHGCHTAVRPYRRIWRHRRRAACRRVWRLAALQCCQHLTHQTPSCAVRCAQVLPGYGAYSAVRPHIAHLEHCLGRKLPLAGGAAAGQAPQSGVVAKSLLRERQA